MNAANLDLWLVQNRTDLAAIPAIPLGAYGVAGVGGSVSTNPLVAPDLDVGWRCRDLSDTCQKPASEVVMDWVAGA